MEFRRSGHRDERRRRVLMEDAKQVSSGDSSEREAKRTGPAKSSNSYAEGARADRQPRITDLLPTRVWTLFVLGLLGATSIAALETLYCEVYLQLSPSFRAAAAGLDLESPYSLGRWFSTLTFAGASALCLIIFSLRRHRVDDYRGRYRIWLPVALLMLLASAESIGGLGRLLAAWLDSELDWPLPHRPAVWWAATIAGGGGLLLFRLLIEMRACRLASLFWSLSMGLYVVALALWGGVVELPSQLQVMAQQGLWLSGHFLVFFSLLIYGRFVFLAAQGQIVPRSTSGRRRWFRKPSTAERDKQQGKAARSKPRTRRTATGTVRVDAAHQATAEKQASGDTSRAKSTAANSPKANPPKVSIGSSTRESGAAAAGKSPPSPASSKTRANSSGPASTGSGETGEPVGPDSELGDERKLSKAERRKLRKETRRHQRI